MPAFVYRPPSRVQLRLKPPFQPQSAAYVGRGGVVVGGAAATSITFAASGQPAAGPVTLAAQAIYTGRATLAQDVYTGSATRVQEIYTGIVAPAQEPY